MKVKIWVLVIILMVTLVPDITVRAQGYQVMKATIETESGRRAVEIRYQPGSEEWAKNIFNTIKKGFPLLEEKIGVPCPTVWDILIVEATNLGEGVGGVNKGPDGIFVPADTSPSVIIHELCHYWFGHIIVKPRNWILEGFPEAYTIQVLKELGHPEAYLHWYGRLDQYEEAKAEIGDQPLSEVGYHPGFSDPEVGLMYSKAMVFSTWLIMYFGEEKMRKINEIIIFEELWLSENYKKIAEEASGEDLDWLFSGWVFEGEYYYEGKVVSFEWFAGDGDKDGISTLAEIEMGSNPFVADTDKDGLPDGQELLLRTDPENPDTDGDLLKDGDEVSIILDGKNTEWSDPVINDERGDSISSQPQDIKAVYYAADQQNIYFMIEFYESIKKVFHSGIRIDTNDDGTTDFIFYYGYDHITLSIWEQGEWVESIKDPQLLGGAAVVADEVMEFKIPKRMRQVRFPDTFSVWAYERSVLEEEPSDRTHSVSLTIDQNLKESTNPRSPDTDGDGLSDGEDPDPLMVTAKETVEPVEPEETVEPSGPVPKEPEQKSPEPEPSEEKDTPFHGIVVLLGMILLLLAKRVG